MGVFHRIRSNRVFVACVVLVGLSAWATTQMGSVHRPTDPRLVRGPQHSLVSDDMAAIISSPPTLPSDTIAPAVEETRFGVPVRNSTASVVALPALKPGMTRAEVEGLLGLPPADQIQGVTVNEGRMTYRTTYELSEQGVPMTIRPIKSRARVPSRSVAPHSSIALEYDASQPGHPLLQVLYSDPLF